MNVQQMLSLSKPPIAVGFFDAPPDGLEKWNGGPVPAGCRFWREAMQGRSFYTEPSDHFSCAVGSYTHGIAIPTERGAVLEDTIGFMVGQGYIQMAEVPAIPVLPRTPAYIAYGPVEENRFRPDVVLIAARPYAAMLLYEATMRAGAGNALTHAMGRPGCAVIPLSVGSETTALSFGCKGNRQFTGLPDDELYLSVPGGKWTAVVEALDRITRANAAMESYYKQHEQEVARHA